MKNKNTHKNLVEFPAIQFKLAIIFGFFFFFNHLIFASDFQVITNPKPNMKEDKIVYLEEVQKIAEDLGNDQYLFHPVSIAADKSDIYVYDSSQARIFHFTPDLKLIDSFGRKGQGPGEFSGTGNTYFVNIAIGEDGNLIASDFQALRMIKFDKKGKHLKTFNFGFNDYVNKPVGDKQGNFIYVSVKDDVIQIKNEKNEILTQCKNNQIMHKSFLFEEPAEFVKKRYESQSFSPETIWNKTIDSKILIYFQSSSTLVVLDEKGCQKTFQILPEKALQSYIKCYRQSKKNLKKKYSFYMPMFGALIVDQDDKEVFYLKLSGDQIDKKIASTLYAFNLSGKLLKVIHVPINPELEEGETNYATVHAKVNNIFYCTRSSEEIVLYKEIER